MFIKTSVGLFSKDDFIQRCNEGLFPEGLEIVGESSGLLNAVTVADLPKEYFISYPPESTGTPAWEIRTYWLDLCGCSKLTSLPAGLRVSGDLDITGCSSLVALPDGLFVGDTLYVDAAFIKKYPFKDLPKISHLPFLENKKQILLKRLRNGN